MSKEYIVNHLSKLAFYTHTPTGHDIFTDARKEIGGHDCAASPIEHMIAGLGGCTGIDTVMILNKMKVTFDDLKIRIQTEKRKEVPETFTSIHLVYEFKGKDLPMDKLQRAAQLSVEKYCTAAAIFKGTANITYEIKIIE